MTQQFTASEARELAKHMESVGWRPDSNGDPDCCDEGAARSAEMLFAFADMLEAQERAVPVAITCDGYDGDRTGCIKSDKPLPLGTNLYTHPAPSDAERLAEALRAFPEDPNPFTYRRCYANARAALAAHSAQAQPPAASVTDAMVNAAMLAYNVECHSQGASTNARADGMRTALAAALAAQENPNGF